MRSPDPLNRTQQGSVLVIVILVLLAVSTLATTMIVHSQGEHLISANERDAERALQASLAGIHYGFDLLESGLLNPTLSGAPYNSFAAPVTAALEGAEFSGNLYDAPSASGSLFVVESTGAFNRAQRTTELVVQIVPEALRYGFIGFNEVTLHNHSGLAGPSFKIESTIYSNGDVNIPQNLTLDGAMVASDKVTVASGSIVKGSVFANSVSNSGTIEGNAMLLTAVASLDPTSSVFDRLDAYGAKYEWFNGASLPGSLSGGGTLMGTESSYAIQNSDVFNSEIIRLDGSMITNPNINVVQYVPPPQLDYAAMKSEADLNDPTYFTAAADLYAYLATKKVDETVAGYNVTTIKVGTPTDPEFIYLDDDFDLELDPTLSADSGNQLKAHGFILEGGMYVSGSWEVKEAPFLLPPNDYYPAPPDYYAFKINALDYCYPAIISYDEPAAAGPPSAWNPSQTPVIGSAGKIDMKSGSPNGGFSYLHGVVYSGGEIHLHHTQNNLELIRFIGAELAYKIHNCDYMAFTYSPQVRCTRFLGGVSGTPGVVSFREVR